MIKKSAGSVDSDRKSIERRQRLRQQINVAKINRLPQIPDLIVSFGFIDIDIPSPRSALIARAPAIAAFFEFVFEIEWGLFSPNPYCLSTVVRSVRNPGNDCVVCFRPALVNNVRTGAHLEYRWEGQPDPKVTQISAG
jgi:hypothetical protein